MTARRFILSVLCLYGGICFAAVSCLDAEDALRRRVVQRGLRVGTDLETGSYTVIAGASMSGSAPGSSAYDAQKRATCFRLAELKAMHQILNMRAQTMSGKSEVKRERLGDEAVKTVSTFVETLSQSDTDGCVVVDSCELHEGAKCVVAVAMTWSVDLECRARASAAGSIQPAEKWIEELKIHLSRWDGRMLPPTVAFVDSAGFFHRLGVGAASLTGESPLERKAAVGLADLLARKNFQLALYGRAAMRKKAALMMASSRREDCQSLASAYEALGDVSVEGPLPLGSCPLFDKIVGGQDGSGKSLLVVYGIKESGHASACGVGDRETASTMQTAPASNSGVMVFNPNTRRYERKE